jgi:tetratricopeptide (TPR) repeat protein
MKKTIFAVIVLALALHTTITAQTEPKTAKEYSDRADKYYEKKEYDKAIADYSAALKIDPNYIEAFIYRGITYSFKREWEKAIADFNVALKIDANCAKDINPFLAIAYERRGLTYIDKKEYDKAIADYNAALKINPDKAKTIDHRFVVAFLMRGSTYIDKKEYDKAIADCNDALKIDPNYADAFFLRGNAYVFKLEWDKAIADFEAVLRIDPKNSQAKRILEEMRKKKTTLTDTSTKPQQQNEEERLKDAINANPNNPKLYWDLAEYYVSQRKNALAVAEYEKIVEIEPTYRLSQEDGWKWTASNAAYFGIKSDEKISINNFSVYLMLAAYYFDSASYEKALASYRKGYEIDITNGKNNNKNLQSMYLGAIGLTLDRLGRTDEANSTYKELAKVTTVTEAIKKRIGK